MENTTLSGPDDSVETLNFLLNSAVWTTGALIVPSCEPSKTDANDSTEVR